MPEPKLYDWSVTIGTACNKQSRTFQDLAEKLKMDVTDLMRQCNGKVAPSKSLVKGMARELDLSESMLDRLTEEVRKDLGPKCSQAQSFRLTYISAALCIRGLAPPSTTIPPPILLQSSITIDCQYRSEKFQRVAQYFFIGCHDSVCFTASGGELLKGIRDVNT
jgi:hypothetical protein